MRRGWQVGLDKLLIRCCFRHERLKNGDGWITSYCQPLPGEPGLVRFNPILWARILISPEFEACYPSSLLSSPFSSFFSRGPYTRYIACPTTKNTINFSAPLFNTLHSVFHSLQVLIGSCSVFRFSPKSSWSNIAWGPRDLTRSLPLSGQSSTPRCWIFHRPISSTTTT